MNLTVKEIKKIKAIGETLQDIIDVCNCDTYGNIQLKADNYDKICEILNSFGEVNV